MDAADLLQRLWMATLALTAMIVVVAVLRVVWRRAFGAEQACRLWWLPPLAVIVSQLPHAAVPAVVLQVPTMPGLETVILGAVAATTTATPDWSLVAILAWVGGVLICLLVAAWRQWWFTHSLRDARALPSALGSPAVLRLADTQRGPALVGAWRPRIVVPADFEQRYDADERGLILAHESEHARRRDGLACALATLVQALFWFHPLAWWALRRFRRDQELACDAAVVHRHPHARRSYAVAMLKTQTTTPILPAGCPWLSRHPIKERIAMLKLPVPGPARRRVGHAAILAVVLGASTVVYAAQPLPMPRQAPAADQAASSSASVAGSEASGSVYQLAMTLMRAGKVLSAPIVCVRANSVAEIEQGGEDNGTRWHFKLKPQSLPAGQVQVSISGSLRDSDGHTLHLDPTLRGPLGHAMSASVGLHSRGGKLELTLIPTAGCAVSKHKSDTRITLDMDGSTRAVAERIAKKAALSLANPEVLNDSDTAHVRFKDYPARTALGIVAAGGGMQTIFGSVGARFEPKAK